MPGSKYGSRLRKNLMEIRARYSGRKKCPYCGKKGLVRVFKGVWHCKRCNIKIAGKCYDPPTLRDIKNYEKIGEVV